jgi:hypothetical protein
VNIYFLVEGKRTEMKVYPKWLSILIPELQKVSNPREVTINNYYMFSGNGFPSLLNHLRNCVEDINSIQKFNYFVMCLDADEKDIENCRQEIFNFMSEENIKLNSNVSFEIIVQNRCLETWFLGNSKIFKKNPTSDFLRECVHFYNVKKNDPELMGKPDSFEGSVSIFHSSYSQELLAERNINYRKSNPQGVIEKSFLAHAINKTYSKN